MNNVTWLDFNNAPDSSQTFPEKMNAEAVKQALCNNLPHVLRHLFPNGKKNGNHYEVGDIWGNKGKSMKIALTGNDKGLWIDHATGDKGDVLHLWALCHNQCIKSQFHQVTQSAADWLGIAPLEAPVSLPKAEPVSLGHHSAKYDYYSADHKLIACVYRYDTETGKEFRPFDVVSGKSKAPEPRPLYNLPNIVRQSQIILCEGEKSADSLIKLGIPATTAMFGSKAPLDKTDWSPLKNKHVIIWPDNDVSGQEYAQKLQAFLPAQGIASISILQIPEGKKEGWDAADAVLEGMDVKGYLAENITTPEDNTYEAFETGHYLDDPQPIQEDLIAPRILTPSGLLVFGGAPKVGKSDFILSWLMHMAAGAPFLDMTPSRPMRIFYLQAEIAYDYLRERIKSVKISPNLLASVRTNLVITPQCKMILDDIGVRKTANTIKKHFFR